MLKAEADDEDTREERKRRMNERRREQARDGAGRPRKTGWRRFAAALQAQDADAPPTLFLADGLWRDVLAFTWTSADACPAAPQIEATLRQTLARTKPANFHIPPQRTPPRWVSRAGTRSDRGHLRIRDRVRPGNGIVRLVPDPQTPSRLRAWTLVTTLQELARPRGSFQAARGRKTTTRDFGADNWLDRLNKRARLCRPRSGGHRGRRRPGGPIDRGALASARRRYADRRPARTDRRQLAQALSLADAAQRSARQSPALLPFPPTFPIYIPKDKLANWFESYVEAMELNFWTGTELVGGSYDDAAQAMVGHAAAHATAATRVMHPRHLIFATGVSSIPYVPDLPGLADFGGTVVHSGAFKNAEQWSGKKALVLGTGTSGHDVAQELHAHGADVTMIQRSKTYVVSLQGSAERLRDLFRRHPVRGLRPAGDLDALPGAATLLSTLDRARPRGRQGAARRAREARLPAALRRRRDRLPDDVSAARRRLLFQRRLLRPDHRRQNRPAAIFRHRKLRRARRAGCATAASCRPTCWCWRPATRTSRTPCAPIWATPSPTRSARSGASTRAASCATCGGAPRSRGCGSPPAVWRNAGFSRAIWRSRSRRWRPGC